MYSYDCWENGKKEDDIDISLSIKKKYDEEKVTKLTKQLEYTTRYTIILNFKEELYRIVISDMVLVSWELKSYAAKIIVVKERLLW